MKDWQGTGLLDAKGSRDAVNAEIPEVLTHPKCHPYIRSRIHNGKISQLPHKHYNYISIHGAYEARSTRELRSACLLLRGCSLASIDVLVHMLTLLDL